MATNSKPSLVDRLSSAWEAFTDKTPVYDSEEIQIHQGKAPATEAFFPTNGSYRLLFAGSFNGEKNLGEIGPIKYYMMDYVALSLRSWQAYLESSTAQTVINKFCTWVIGKGLKLQSEPARDFLEMDAAVLKKFSNSIEARWGVYANSKQADHAKRKTLNQIAKMCYKAAIVGGDVLVLLRYEDDCITVQLVDGNHLTSPISGSEWFPLIAKNGNRMMNGIEVDDNGRHVAYYVRKPYDSLNPLNTLEWDRIPAKGGSGILSAFMVYGLEYRLDTHRGIPLLTAVLEKLKKMERYEEATLGSAEEQAKIAYQVVHDMGSTGEFPFSKSIAAAHNADISNEDIAADDLGRALTDKVFATTNKQAINNPQGAEIKPLRDSKTQLYFKDFLDKNIDQVCSAIEMPPNVAMSQYDSNYSASRAAIKDWEHTLIVKRSDFSSQFYQNIYNFFLEIEIRKNNIQAPGYLLAQAKKDYMSLEAYRTARFVGAPVANIDPVKEVEAERKKLGITAESIPLTTVEAATEALNGGDHAHNMEQYAEELEESKALGLKPEPEVQQSAVVSDK
jgi:capsid protein